MIIDKAMAEYQWHRMAVLVAETGGLERMIVDSTALPGTGRSCGLLLPSKVLAKRCSAAGRNVVCAGKTLQDSPAENVVRRYGRAGYW